MPLSRRAVLGSLAVSGAALAGCASDPAPEAAPGATTSPTPSPTPPSSAPPSAPPSAPSSSATPTTPAAVAGTARGSAEVVETLARGVNAPWGLARLPDGTVLVTSRDERVVRRLDPATGAVEVEGAISEATTDVDDGGEGGLLGIAVSPTYDTDRRLFLYHSTASENRVVSLRHRPDRPAGRRLGPRRTIVGGIPHGTFHNGGRLLVGPDGMLWASTGEAYRPELAPDLSSLGGKVLRMTLGGDPAPGNPFGTLVWSYGHRNVQGLAFDASGRLLASEFGDKTADELNVIVAGADYGWPTSEGRTDDPGVVSPIAQWGTEEDSPSGIAVAAGCVWMAALQGQCLWRIPLDGEQLVAEPVAFLRGQHGRLRSVLALDDATLLVTTSNTDGRGDPGADDDQVLRVAVT